MARSNPYARALSACAARLKAWTIAAERAIRAAIAPELALIHAQRLEMLESRQLLSISTIIGSTLDLEGELYARNTITVTKSGASAVLATINGASKTYSLSSFSKIALTGGTYNDTLTIASGINKPSIVRAGLGNDLVKGGDGSDTIYGEPGNDSLYGNAGNDFLYGEEDNDYLNGGAGTDALSGGAGTNTLVTGESTNTGGTGNTGGGSTSSTGSVAITSLVLYNADTDKPIMTLGSGAVIDLSKTGKSLTIVARTSSSTKSVKFGMDSSSSYRIESSAPFSLKGDTNGNLASWAPSTGAHTVSATPFSKASATGTAGAKVSFSITVKNSSTTGSTGNTGGSSGGSTGGSSGGGPTPTGSTAGSPDAAITVQDATVAAGHAVFVNGLSSKLNAGDPTSASYEWDFGDSGSKYNTLAGFNAAHIYDDPGDYTIRLTVTNEARKLDTATYTVHVSSSGRRVIYVSNDGSDSADGSPGNPIRTVTRAFAMIHDNTEIRFNRGDTFSVNDTLGLWGRHNVLVGAYGSGADPMLRYTGDNFPGAAVIGTGAGSDQATIQDLAFDSIYRNYDDGMPQGVGIGGTNTIVRNCTFYNLSDAINTVREPAGVLVQDNSCAMGMRGYFAWVQGSDQVYLGNSCPDSQYQHVLRNGGTNRLLIAYNNFSNPGTAVIKGTLTIHKGDYIYIAHNTLSQGRVYIGPLRANDPADRTRYVVFEDNKVNSTVGVDPGTEHIMLRNNIVTANGIPEFDVAGYDDTWHRGVVDVTIANNTGVNNDTDGNFLHVWGEASGITLVNNLYLAPNLQTGGNVAAPVFVNDSDLSSFTKIANNVWPSPTILKYAQGGINYVWPYWSNASGYKTATEWDAYGVVTNEHYVDTSYNSSYAPSSSSTAATAATPWAGVFKDYYGNTRSASGSWTAGAIEV